MSKLFFFLLTLFLLSGCQKLCDLQDQNALRRQCRVPSYGKLVQYDGFPCMVGFGQREGLGITGTFLIREADAARFKQFIEKDGWLPLPLPPGVKDRLPPDRFSLPEKGFFRCRTAGDNVLHAWKTYPCTEDRKVLINTSDWGSGETSYKTRRAFIDIILTVYDSEKKTITAHVESGY